MSTQINAPAKKVLAFGGDVLDQHRYSQLSRHAWRISQSFVSTLVSSQANGGGVSSALGICSPQTPVQPVAGRPLFDEVRGWDPSRSRKCGWASKLRQALGLPRLPDFATFYRFLERLDELTMRGSRARGYANCAPITQKADGEFAWPWTQQDLRRDPSPRCSCGGCASRQEKRYWRSSVASVHSSMKLARRVAAQLRGRGQSKWS
jgi:hypothetical protein